MHLMKKARTEYRKAVREQDIRKIFLLSNINKFLIDTALLPITIWAATHFYELAITAYSKEDYLWLTLWLLKVALLCLITFERYIDSNLRFYRKLKVRLACYSSKRRYAQSRKENIKAQEEAARTRAELTRQQEKLESLLKKLDS